jgi:hydroxymethylbilane synthase
MGERLIRVGTRGSALARAQTRLVVTALHEAQPELLLETVVISTSGDRSQHTNQPDTDWGSGVFVKEIEAALLRNDIDLAVHSLKDVPPEVTPDLTLAAIPPREEPLDALVTPDGVGLDALPQGARVGTSSARRTAFLRALRPDLDLQPIRGNVETRVRKLEEGLYDAIILAMAGLRRLELRAKAVALEPLLMPPAPGQGALAVQVRAGERDVLELVEPLHDPASGAAIRAERRLMALLDGGCRLPVGALATPRLDGGLVLIGGVAHPDGHKTLIDSLAGRLADPESLADALVERLTNAGARELIATVAA